MNFSKKLRRLPTHANPTSLHVETERTASAKPTTPKRDGKPSSLADRVLASAGKPEPLKFNRSITSPMRAGLEMKIGSARKALRDMTPNFGKRVSTASSGMASGIGTPDSKRAGNSAARLLRSGDLGSDKKHRLAGAALDRLMSADKSAKRAVLLMTAT